MTTDIVRDDNREIIYCAEGDEHRRYCDICDNLFIDRYSNNHLISRVHITNNRKKQHLNNTNINI